MLHGLGMMLFYSQVTTGVRLVKLEGLFGALEGATGLWRKVASKPDRFARAPRT